MKNIKTKKENINKIVDTKDVFKTTNEATNKTNNNINTFIGIDVGKFFIDVYCSLNDKYYKRIPNDESSIKTLITTIKKDIGAYNTKNRTNINITDNVLTVIDKTGSYEVICRDLFYNNGFNKIYLADGKQINYFKKSKKNNIAKTDKMDSYILALYGKMNIEDLMLYVKDPNEETITELKKIQLRIQDLKHTRTQEKNRLQAPNTTKLIKKDIEQTIAYLDRHIDKLDKEATDIINNNAELKAKHLLLTQEKGIGVITSMILLSFLPELGKTNKRQIAAISGTAPAPYESGTSVRGHRTTKGTGRSIIKQTMFIVILTLIRDSDSVIGQFYNSLLARGKSKRLAIVACMRKEIIHLNSLLKSEYYEKIVGCDKILA